MALIFRKLRKLDLGTKPVQTDDQREEIIAKMLEELARFREEQRVDKQDTDWVKKLLEEMDKMPKTQPIPFVPYEPYKPYEPYIPTPVSPWTVPNTPISPWTVPNTPTPYPWNPNNPIWYGDPLPSQMPTNICWNGSTDTADLSVTVDGNRVYARPKIYVVEHDESAVKFDAMNAVAMFASLSNSVQCTASNSTFLTQSSNKGKGSY